MFFVSSQDLPSDYPVFGSGITGFLPSVLETGYAMTGVYDQERVLLFTEGTLQIPSFLATIEIPLVVGAVTNLVIGKKVYNLAENDNPSPGEYYYSPTTQILVINPVEGLASAPRAGDLIYYSGLSEKADIVRTTQILKDIPAIFKSWNAYGQAQFSSSFEGHPTVNFQFVANESAEANIRNTFIPDKQINIYGIGYEPRQLTVTYHRANKKIGVEVNLQGIWSPKGDRNKLDQPIELKGFAGNKTITLSQLGAKIGVASSGGITIPIEKNLSDDATTTFRRELESRAATVGGFVDYTNPSSPGVKQFGSTPTRFLSYADVLQKEWTISYLGTGALFEGVRLSYELNNVRLKLEKDENEQGDEELTLLEGYPRPDIPPDIAKSLFRSNRFAFDMGGPTKTRREIKLLNSTTLKEIIKVYGFVYTEADTHVVSAVTRPENPEDPNSPLIDTYEIRFAEPTFGSYWQQVKQIQINHVYNTRTGDYEAAPGNGWELARFLKSNSNLEICELIGAKISTDDPAEQAQLQKVIDAYAFFRNPVTANTFFELEEFGDHYEDISQEDTPKFARLTTQTENSFATIPDPRIGDDNQTLPPLIVGTKRTQETRRTIASTQKELYKETEIINNAEGSDFGETAKSETHRDVRGRPPVHLRLERLGKARSPKSPEASNKTYRVNTPGSLNLKNNQLFPIPSGITDLSSALKTLNTIVAKENSLNAVRLSLQIIRQPQWRVGDIIVFEGRRWVLLSIKETQDILQDLVFYRPVSIELGQLLRPNVSATVQK